MDGCGETPAEAFDVRICFLGYFFDAALNMFAKSLLEPDGCDGAGSEGSAAFCGLSSRGAGAAPGTTSFASTRSGDTDAPITERF